MGESARALLEKAIFYPGVSSVGGAIFSAHYPPLMKCTCKPTKSPTYPSLNPNHMLHKMP